MCRWDRSEKHMSQWKQANSRLRVCVVSQFLGFCVFPRVGCCFQALWCQIPTSFWLGGGLLLLSRITSVQPLTFLFGHSWRWGSGERGRPLLPHSTCQGFPSLPSILPHSRVHSSPVALRLQAFGSRDCFIYCMDP